MERAWVGPLYWIQWAGGHRRLHPRGRRPGPGGELPLPDCAVREGLYGACPILPAHHRFGRNPTVVLSGDQGSYHHSSGREGRFRGAFRGRIHVAVRS